MSTDRRNVLNELLDNFLVQNSDIDSLIISNPEGKVIAGVKKKGMDMELFSILTVIVNPTLRVIQDEFAFKKFGTAAFDTEDNRLLFIAINQDLTLSIVLNALASIDKVAPYAYLIAEKSAQIIESKDLKSVNLSIPMFEHLGTSSERIKGQIYELKMESGGIYRFKFIILGDHEVGKTSIVRRYVENMFSDNYRATIGLNILAHSFKFLDNEIKLSLWDIGAQKFFKRYRKNYYHGAQAAFMVFDLTRKESFANLKEWFIELREFYGKNDLPIVIVGNKSDLKEKRQVEYEDGVKLVNELSRIGMPRISYIETSAATGENIADAFSLITYHYIMQNKDKEEMKLNQDLFHELKSILDTKNALEITFISEKAYWSPGLQILTDISLLGSYEIIKDEKDEKIYKYESGLTIKNNLYDSIDVAKSDAVFCIFDMRGKSHVDPKWTETVIKILNNIKKESVVLIGIRLVEDFTLSGVIEEFKIDKEMQKKVEEFMYFQLEEDYRTEIYEQLMVMLRLIDKMAWMSYVS